MKNYRFTFAVMTITADFHYWHAFSICASADIAMKSLITCILKCMAAIEIHSCKLHEKNPVNGTFQAHLSKPPAAVECILVTDKSILWRQKRVTFFVFYVSRKAFIEMSEKGKNL